MSAAAAGRVPSRVLPLFLLAAVVACGSSDPSSSGQPAAAGGAGSAGTAGGAGSGSAVQGGAAGAAAGGTAGAAAGAAGTSAKPDLVDEEACTAHTKAAATLTAAADAAGAATASFAPDAGPVLVTLPTGGAGYVSFKLTTPHHDLAFFVSSPGALVSLRYGGTTVATPAATANPACPAEVGGSVRVHVHAPGAYTIELAPSSEPVWLFVSGA